MRIPRNFDRWMFDYKEGNLSPSEVEYFEQHMLNNTANASDIDAWDQSFVRNEPFQFQNKEALLKKPANSKRFIAVVALFIFFSFSTLSLFWWMNTSEGSLNTSEQAATKPLKNEWNQDENLYHQNKSTQLKSENTSVASSNEFIISSNDHLPTYPNEVIKNETNSESRIEMSDEMNSDSKEFNTKKQNHQAESIKNDEQLIQIEVDKISNSSTNHQATYKNNPNYASSQINTKRNRNTGYHTLSYKIRKITRKIAQKAGYPVGLTNLRDHHFSIPENNILDLNGGFVGGQGISRLNMKYRNQWMNTENHSENYQLSFDSYSRDLKSGIGVVFTRNDFNKGQFTDNNIKLIYSPKFALTKKVTLEPSITFGIGVMTVNAQKLDFYPQHEINRGQVINTYQYEDISTSKNYLYKDFGLGVLINADKFYFGINANNLGQHHLSIYNNYDKADIQLNAVVGIDYLSRNKKTTLSPYLVYNQYGDFKELWGGLQTQYTWLTAGVSYSTNLDYSGNFGLKFKTFRLIYQYDRTKSYLSAEKFSSHMLSARFNLNNNKKR